MDGIVEFEVGRPRAGSVWESESVRNSKYFGTDWVDGTSQDSGLGILRQGQYG